MDASHDVASHLAHLLPLSLAAIRQLAPSRPITEPAEAWLWEHNAETWVYVNDRHQAHVGLGEIYTTFIVRFDKSNALLGVSHYRSRKGADGDDTLPP